MGVREGGTPHGEEPARAVVGSEVGIVFVDVSGLDWDDDEPTIVQTPLFGWVLLEDASESVEVELPEWEQSVEVDLLFLEPELC
jgi:hypothetical protein